MNIELNKQEIWKILDALEAYKKNYAVSGAVTKTINNIEKRLKDSVNNE
jgi:sulfur relay (sulfurtransferase) DsrC/TusE family protein